MILGFTGTSRGMTQEQSMKILYLFNNLQLLALHHGDCIGADAQAHEIAKQVHARIVIHPPMNTKSRAFCQGADEVYIPKPYLVRNLVIARLGTDGLIATPSSESEIVRSGTWSTIRYARKMKRHIWIVFPDGTVREE